MNRPPPQSQAIDEVPGIPPEPVLGLVQRFADAGLTPTSRELADVIWLASRIAPVDRGAQSDRSMEGQHDGQSDVLSEAGDSGRIDDVDEQLSSQRHEPSAAAHGAPALDDASGDMPAEPVDVSGVAGLANASSLARAWRDLRRSRPARHRQVFDAEATADRFAEQQLAGHRFWQPVWRPRQVPWLDLDLVVDSGPSMLVWETLVDELETLLRRTGCFGRFSRWRLDTGRGGPLLSQNGRTWTPERLSATLARCSDPGYRLSLIVSDCVSPGWYQPNMRKLLAALGRGGRVAMVQLLPSLRWVDTALGDAQEAELVPVATASGALPDLRPIDRAEDEQQLEGEQNRSPEIPVIELIPWDIQQLVRLLAAVPGAQLPGYRFDQTATQAPPSPYAEVPTPEERLDFFLEAASPNAKRLAAYLSRVPYPLTLVMMRAVQAAMHPDGRVSELAEVFSGGILDVNERNEQGAPVSYRFAGMDTANNEVGTVIDTLARTIRSSDAFRIMSVVSSHLQRRGHAGIDWTLYIADPNSSSEHRLRSDLSNQDGYDSAFAMIGTDVLRRMGGERYKAADRIDNIVRERTAAQGLSQPSKSGNAESLSVPSRAEPPPFLVRLGESATDGEPSRLRGSGILLAADWVLTVRDVVQLPPPSLRHRSDYSSWIDLDRPPTVWLRGERREVVEVRTDDEIALVRLDHGLSGPYAPLLDIRQGSSQSLLPRLELSPFGVQIENGITAPTVRLSGIKAISLFWNSASGELEQLQLQGGTPMGFSGAPVCAWIEDRWCVLAMINQHGPGQATFRALGLAPILRLVGQVPGLEPDRVVLEAERAVAADYSRELSAQVLKLLEHLASGKASENEVLLGAAFAGCEHDPRPFLRTDGAPHSLAAQWLSNLEHAHCIDGHSSLVRLLQEGFSHRPEQQVEYPGGYQAVLRDLDAPCRRATEDAELSAVLTPTGRASEADRESPLTEGVSRDNRLSIAESPIHPRLSEPLPFLVRVGVSAVDGEPAVPRGSGILLAADWVLTARHVVQQPQPTPSNVRRWRELDWPLAVWVRGEWCEVVEVHPDANADIALLRLDRGLPGPYAPLLDVPDNSIHELQRVPLITWGFSSAGDIDASALQTSWPKDFSPLWNSASGELEQLQLQGGTPMGFGGAPVCTRVEDRWCVLGMIYLGGDRAATSRALGLAPILRLVGQVPGLEPELVVMSAYSHELLAAVRTLLENILSDEAARNEVLLKAAFDGREHNPMRWLQTGGHPPALADQWLWTLQQTRCIEGHSPLVWLLQAWFRGHTEPQVEYTGGLPALLRDLDAPCRRPNEGLESTAAPTPTQETPEPDRKVLLIEFLLELPIWQKVSDRSAFVVDALGAEHPALPHTNFDGSSFTVATELSDNLVRYDLSQVDDGSHAVCDLVRVACERGYNENKALHQSIVALVGEFGCPESLLAPQLEDKFGQETETSPGVDRFSKPATDERQGYAEFHELMTAVIRDRKVSRSVGPTLTRVGPDPSDPSQIVFLEEVPADYDRMGRVTIKVGETYIDLLHEVVKIAAKPNRALKGARVTIAEIPYHGFHVRTATLRSGFRGREADKPTPPPDIATDVTALETWLSEQRFDYWERNPRFLSASSWARVMPAPWLLELWEYTHRNAVRKPEVAWGLCTAYNDCLEKIQNSSEFRKVVAKTQYGTWRSLTAGSNILVPPLPAVLKDTVEELLTWSVKQAMAGAGMSESSADLQGRPVMELAERIYNNHLYQISHRYHTIQRNQQSVAARQVDLDLDSLPAVPETESMSLPSVKLRIWAEQNGLSEKELDVLDELYEVCELKHWESDDAAGAWSLALGYLREKMSGAERAERMRQLRKLLLRLDGDFDADRVRSVIEQSVAKSGE